MKLSNLPFETLDWHQVPVTTHAGENGVARWRTRQLGDIRVRMVEYSPGYKAEGWCEKGHLLLCIDGEFNSELKDGRVIKLTPGVSYFVGDGEMPHRSSTEAGAMLYIVD